MATTAESNAIRIALGRIRRAGGSGRRISDFRAGTRAPGLFAA